MWIKYRIAAITKSDRVYFGIMNTHHVAYIDYYNDEHDGYNIEYMYMTLSSKERIVLYSTRKEFGDFTCKEWKQQALLNMYALERAILLGEPIANDNITIEVYK